MPYCMIHIANKWTGALLPKGNVAKDSLFAQEATTGLRLIV